MFIFIACGIWLIGLGMYFMVISPPLLPEDLRYMGTSPGEIQSAMPGLERWLRRVFTVMGGFMTGAGVLTIIVAMNASAVGEKGTWIVLALAVSADRQADAMLAASRITHFPVNSPTLYVDADRLPPETLAEMKRLGNDGNTCDSNVQVLYSAEFRGLPLST